MERKTAVIIISALKGEVRAARGLVSRALNQTLNLKRHHEDPHYVCYTSDAVARSHDSENPRYYVTCTENEFKSINYAIYRLSQQGGWDKVPVDCYWE